MKKRANIQIVVVLLFIIGLGGCEQANTQTEDLVTVDVTQSYPKKELVLQDFMDVEYIPLETNDEFVTIGWPHAVGKDYIVVRNRSRTSSDGDIFIFDRKGKSLRKINRMGQGDEEYAYPLGIALDEENNELFVNDHWKRKMFVYDLSGNFKRSFNHLEGRGYDMGVYNFDRDNLLCCGLEDVKFEKPNVFVVISKQDGSVTKEIEILYKKIVSSLVFSRDSIQVMPIRNKTFVPSGGISWMIMESSSDTIYSLQSNNTKTPIIARTPAVESMSPPILLYPAVATDRYYFMQTVKAAWDFGTRRGHDRVNLMYDRKKNQIYEYVLHNADMISEEPITMTSEITVGNDEIALVKKLESHELVEAYEKGKLKGELKKIAAQLNDESNPILMLVKYKK